MANTSYIDLIDGENTQAAKLFLQCLNGFQKQMIWEHPEDVLPHYRAFAKKWKRFSQLPEPIQLGGLPSWRWHGMVPGSWGHFSAETIMAITLSDATESQITDSVYEFHQYQFIPQEWWP